MAEFYINDTTLPRLVNFAVDMNTGMLDLTFDETVDLSTFRTNQLTFVDAMNSAITNYTVVSQGQVVTPDDNTTISLILNETDINRIKFDTSLFTTQGNSFLTFTSNAIVDMSGNLVMPREVSTALGAMSFTPDIEFPVLRSFVLDLTANTVILIFDEPVAENQFDARAVTLLNDEGGNFTRSYTLEGIPNSQALSEFGKAVQFSLSVTDQNELKAYQDFATDSSNTYLSITDQLTVDRARIGNPNAILSLVIPLSATTVTRDSVPPEVVNFPEFNLEEGFLRIIFNEPVNLSSINYERISILSSPIETRTLVAGEATYVDGSLRREIQVQLSLEDLSYIKLSDNLATERSNTMLQLQSGAIEDQSGNGLTGSDIETPLLFVDDRRGPGPIRFVLDLNQGTITITFNDVVRNEITATNINPIDISGISLQADAAGLQTSRISLTQQLDNSAITNSTNGYVTVVFIPLSDLNHLKALRILGTSINNTFLTLAAITIRDIRGNPADPITRTNAFQAYDVIADTTAPRLSAFDLDLDGMGNLRLFFDETVDQVNLNVTQITLIGLNEESLSLSSNDFTPNPPLSSFSIVLGENDLNRIKSLPNLGSYSGNTYVSISSSALNDTSGNPIIEIMSMPLVVQLYEPDITRPSIQSYTLNMNTGELILSFTETVNGSNFDPRQITLSSSSTGTSLSEQLTGGDFYPVFSNVLSLNFSITDLNRLKQAIGLADNSETTFLSFTSDTVTDMESNFVSRQILEISRFTGSPVAEDNYIFDTTSPQLVSFSLNLTSAMLVLSFDETVNASSLNIDQITIQSNPLVAAIESVGSGDDLESGSGNGSIETGSGSSVTGSALSFITEAQISLVKLTSGSENASTSVVQDSTEITIVLGMSDLNNLKLNTGLATNSNNSFISFPNSTINDMNGNLVVAISTMDSKQVQEFYNDFISPMLLRFDLNLTSETISLTFSEVVNALSLNVSQFTVLQGPNSNIGHKLLNSEVNGSSSSGTDGTVVTIYLGVDDLNEIKRNPNLWTSHDNSYLSFTSDSVRDMNGNKLIPRLPNDPLPVSLFWNDFIEPTLTAFNLDINQGLLTLEFSETVNAGSLNVSSIFLLPASQEEANQSFYLTSSSRSISLDGTQLVVNVSRQDLNAIKFLTELARSDKDTYLSISSGTVFDMNFNPVVAVSEINAIPVSTYIPDMVGPNLESFQLNLTSEILTLNFDETVNVSSFGLTKITLQSSAASPQARFALTDGEILHGNSHTVYIQLDYQDLNEIKLDTNLATGSDNTVISLSDDTTDDLALIPNPSFPSVLTLDRTNYFPDTIGPKLLDFSIDLNLELLILNFDEPVNTSSLDTKGITLLDGVDGLQYMLSGGNSTSPNGLQVSIRLDRTDLNNLKQMESILVSEETSFISISPSTIRDMSGNSIQLLSPGSAINASFYVNDTTQPYLVAYDLDLDSDTLTLYFFETVDIMSIDFTGLTLQQASNSTNHHTLTNGSLLNREDSSTIAFLMTTYDLNAVKSQRIALNRETTWLVLDASFVRDQNMQHVLPIVNGVNALPVQRYTNDSRLPRLETYIFDLNANTLTLSFSETVNIVDTFTITGLILLSEPDNSLQSNPVIHQFGSDPQTITTSVYSPVLVINLGRQDLNQIKENTALATNENNTFLTMTSTTIQDMQANNVIPILRTNPLPVFRFVEDRVPPELEMFDLNMNSETITLYFSESINPNTLDVSQLTLQHSLSSISSYSYPFTGGEVQSGFRPNITFQLTTRDLNEVKRISQLGTSAMNTFLNVRRGAIQDINNNFVSIISSYMGIQVDDYVNDMTNPNLVNFDLDLSLEHLILTFDETVNSSSLLVSSIYLQSVALGTSPGERALIGGTVVTPPGPVVMIQLDSKDLNYIKSIPNYATSISNTYLRLDSSAIDDMAGNNVTEIMNGRAISARSVQPDDRDPVLVGFDLDMNIGTLELTFNETVDVLSLSVNDINLKPAEDSMKVFSFNASSGTMSKSLDQPIVRIEISNDDLNEIKFRLDLATDENRTFIELSNLSINDTNQNRVIPTTLQVTDFNEDLTPPMLLSFVLDLDEGILHLTFSETVLYETLDVSQITVQSAEILDSNVPHYRLRNGTTLTERDGVSLSFKLVKGDLDWLKAIRNLTSSQYNTYITISEDAVMDANGNQVVAINETNATRAAGFIMDTTSPFLQYFELDMDSAVLIMTFSETVDAPTLMLLYLTLQDETSASSTFNLKTSIWSMELNPVVYINISKSDLDRLTENRMVARSINSTYITITNLTILDTSGNGVTPIKDGMAEGAITFIPDQTSPILEGFDLDMDSGLLTLYYSETIDIFSLDPTKIMLQSDSSLDATSFTLTGGEITLTDSTVGFVLLTFDDLNEIKRLEDLATCTKNNTFVSLIGNQTLTSDTLQFSSFGSGSDNQSAIELAVFVSYHVLDMAANPIIAIEPDAPLLAMTTQCIPDTTPPRLSNFSLNINNSMLTLTFDETVNSSTLNLNEITFYNGQNDSSQSYKLQSGYAFNENLTGQRVIDILISNVDLNELKRREQLATEVSNTFILITESLVLDMNGNRNREITADNFTGVNFFVPDTRAPMLLSFDLDLTREYLTLSFSETVNATSLNIEGITLQNKNLTFSRNLIEGNILGTFPGGSLLVPNDPVLVIQLGQSDLNYIKIFRDLATDISNSYLTIESGTIRDMNSNMVEEVTPLNPLQVQMFEEDRADPVLVDFELDMDSGELTLTFSETVDVFSLDVSEIFLQNDVASSIEDQWRFTPGILDSETFSTSLDGPTIIVEIGSTDLNEIKRLTQLATSNYSTYLILSERAVNDTNNNPVVSIKNGNATQANLVIPDTSRPQLRNFSLDLNESMLRLTFNETVRFDSLNVTSITLLNSTLISEDFVTLTNGTVTNLQDSTVVDIILTLQDQNDIKRIRSLGTSTSNTFLSILSGGIEDMNENGVIEIDHLNAIQAALFKEDMKNPTLVGFDLDMNSGVISLMFDETVQANSLNVEEITLQNNRPYTGNYSYTLTGGTTSMIDSTVLIINITDNDLNEIKRIRGLASNANESNAYVSITNDTVVDMNNNPIKSVPNPSAIRVNNFVEDTTPPVLYAFDLDMNFGLLTLNFSETVDTLTFNIMEFTIQNMKNASNDFFRSLTLTQENLITGDDTSIIQSLLYFDLNTIKSISYVATNASDTFLSITEAAIEDMNGNPVVPIEKQEALQISEFTVDIQRPVLESFDLDMNTGEITLTFSETVDVSTLDVMEMQFVNSHSSSVHSSFRFSLTTGSNSSDWPILVVDISTEDLNIIKGILMLATSNETTFMRVSEFFIMDAAGNMNVEVNSSQVHLFTPDTTQPQLLSFDLDLTLDILTLTFDETVMGSTLTVSQVTFVNAPLRDSSSTFSGSGSGSNSSDMSADIEDTFINYTLTGGENLPINLESVEMTINLTFEDRNEIKRLYNLSTSFENTFLSITSDFIEDTNLNPVVTINSFNPLQVKFFSSDRRAPELVSFNLDMDGRNVTLFFTETINVDSLNVAHITLQELRNISEDPVEFYTLTSVSYSNSRNSSVVVIQMSEQDANMIKIRTRLAVNRNTSFISFTNSTISDMNGIPVASVSDLSGLKVTTYNRDAMPPVLREVSLNLTSELFIMLFDESVDLSSIQAFDISLYNSRFLNSTRYTFRAAIPVGTNAPMVVLNLTDSQLDLDGIKLLSNLATERNNTFVYLDVGAISDLSVPPNPINSVSLQVAEYYPDTVSPVLEEFYANIDDSILALVFNEAVNSSSFVPQAIRLQNSSMETTSFIALTGML